MFDRMHYVIEEKLTSRMKLRETYNVKDVTGQLLGHVKSRRLRANFWFERTDGIRLAEIHASRKGYKVYDDQSQLQGIIRPAPRKKEEERRFWLALGLTFLPMAVFIAILALSLVTNGALLSGLSDDVFIFLLIGCFGLTFLGLICFGYLGYKGKFGSFGGSLEYWIEDARGRILAKAKGHFTLRRNLEIQASDQSVVARIHRELRLKTILGESYRVDILTQHLDPLVILTYAVIVAKRVRSQRQMTMSMPS